MMKLAPTYLPLLIVVLLMLAPTLRASRLPLQADEETIQAHFLLQSTLELVGLLDQYRSGSTAEQTSLVPVITSVAVERRGYLESTIPSQSDIVSPLILSEPDRLLVDAIIPGQTMQPAVLVGRLNAYRDVTGPTETHFELFEDTSGLELGLFFGGPVPPDLVPGTTVRVMGSLLNTDFLVPTAESIVVLSGGLPVVGVSAPKYLLVLVNLKLTPASVNVPLVLTTYQVDIPSLYSDVSYGDLIIDTDSSLLEPKQPIAVDLTPDAKRNQIRDAVMLELAGNPMINFSDYYGIAMFVEWNGGNDATWGTTKFNVPGLSGPFELAFQWISNSDPNSFPYTCIHETGHTLGSGHSGYVNMGGLTTSPLQVCEYGDAVCPMGGYTPDLTRCTTEMGKWPQSHWTGLQKYHLGGWLGPDQVETVTAAGSLPGEPFHLRPLGVSTRSLEMGSSKTQLLRIPRGIADSLYIEFRQPNAAVSERVDDLDYAGVRGDGAALLYVRQNTLSSALIFPGTEAPPQLAKEIALQPGDFFEDPCTGAVITLGDIFSTFGEPDTLPVTISPTLCGYLPNSSVRFRPPVGALFEVEASDYDIGSILTFTLWYVTRDATGMLVEVLIETQVVPGSAGGLVTFDISSVPPPFNGPIRLIARLDEDRSGIGCPCDYLSEDTDDFWVYLTQTSPPTMGLTQPGDGAGVTLPFTVDATATDADGVRTVEYWLDPDYSDTCGAGEAHNGVHPPNCKYHSFFPAYSKNFPGKRSRVFSPDFGVAADVI